MRGNFGGKDENYENYRDHSSGSLSNSYKLRSSQCSSNCGLSSADLRRLDVMEQRMSSIDQRNDQRNRDLNKVVIEIHPNSQFLNSNQGDPLSMGGSSQIGQGGNQRPPQGNPQIPQKEWDVLTGSPGQDVFVLAPYDNPVIINNFQDGQDLIVFFVDHLTFEDLTIEPVFNTSGGSVDGQMDSYLEEGYPQNSPPQGSGASPVSDGTVIKLDGYVLAQLNGIDSRLITADDFIFL